jgi:hypothetical protein
MATRNMTSRVVLTAWALLDWSVCGAVAADPAANVPNVTVTAPRPPTPQELAGAAVPRFVLSHVTPSRVIGQLTRWRTSICPLTRGLSDAMNAFVSARIAAVVAAVAPPAAAASCPASWICWLPDARGGEKPAQMTAGDLAFLRALYGANLESPVELEESNIENAMMREFNQQR